ncbi:synaptic vesicle 2-related -like [Paramuricea clavata]|uniref:Synaptic vesicle 2-related -like n=1 Tax=Paramuricea clavata TaxID=317549 RepID=A0A6S7FTE1_PARCT|nr:synaptic vesicle 2-related -like [Paramuricea clavata]
MESWTKLKQFIQSTPLFNRARSDETKAKPTQEHVKYKHISDDDDATDLRADLFKSRSIDDILDDIGLRLFHLKVILILGLLNITDSLEVSMLSIILPSIKSHWNISSFLAGVLTISISAGMIVSSWFWGWVCDKYGRKRGFIGSATFIVVFGFASAFSPNYYWLWISLFLVGFGIATIFEVYVMTMELFPPKYRTMFSVLNAVFWTLGFLLSAVVSTELSVIGYRWALAIVCFPTALFLIGIVFLPDTPHYHLAAGDEQKALNILQNCAPEMDLSNTKLNREHESKRADITQLFRSGYWKITICACIMAFTCTMAYYDLIYTASDVASGSAPTTINELKNDTLDSSSRDLYRIMAWMNLPELVLIILVAVGCYIFTAKSVFLTTVLLLIILQIIALSVLNQRTALLIVTMLSRSLANISTTFVAVYAALLYPTENRSIGVGACVSMARSGMLLGPFIFVTLFAEAYFYGIVFNIGILLLGFVAILLLPSRSGALV